VSVEQVVKEGVARASTLTRDHVVDVALDADLPPVAVDRASVVEVVYMLLDNASKYSPPGTTIRILATRGGEHDVHLEVTDEGPGIPPDLRERVFEKFFRIPAREPRDPRRTGVGLGLPLARRLVEAQAGRIWIESPAGRRGTTVAMTLPAHVGEPAADELRSVSAAH
jgi:two-component system sensor histidine kinase KdpD